MRSREAWAKDSGLPRPWIEVPSGRLVDGDVETERLLLSLGNGNPRESCVRAITHLVYYAGVSPVQACRLTVDSVKLGRKRPYVFSSDRSGRRMTFAHLAPVL